MDAVTGALVAAVVAWLSILAAALLPLRLPRRPLRVVGGISLAALALVVLGAPVPGHAPVVFLVGGVVGLWLGARPGQDRSTEEADAAPATAAK